jgi:SAM-dependent methyltransferase
VSERFAPHELRWTPEHVRRFWSYLAGSAQAAQAYFSSHSGDALITDVARRATLAPGARVLDWGCGPGFLVERLLARGFHAQGLEFSKESAEQTRARCGEHPHFEGVVVADGLPGPLAEASVDAVFVVEVLEHLLPAQAAESLDEIRRILRPGGLLVATTPHDEALEAVKTICPDCGAVFHPWQHLASFTARTLTALCARHGFETIACQATTLGRTWSGRAFELLRRALGRAPGPEPHLVYIGRRPA